MTKQERQAITVYDTDFHIVAIIDEYISLIWKLVYNSGVGGFDLEVPATKENLDIFKKDYYITRNDKNGWQPVFPKTDESSINHCQDVMIIEAIELDFQEDGKTSLIIGGSDITSILKRRIFIDSFYISAQEYNGFFGKLSDKMRYRGLPIYTLYEADFTRLQDNGYLSTFNDLATLSQYPVIEPGIELQFPNVFVDVTNKTSSLPDVIVTSCNIARIRGYYYWLADRYHGFYPEQGSVIHYQNGYYILLCKIPNTAEIRQSAVYTESYSYWYVLSIPKPDNDNYIYEYESGNPTIYTGYVINGSGEAVYPNSGIDNAKFGDIYIYLDSISTMNPTNRIYFCSSGGGADVAKWRYIMEQKRGVLSSNLVPDNVLFGSNGNIIDNSYHDLAVVNGISYPAGFDPTQTPYYITYQDSEFGDGFSELVLEATSDGYLVISQELITPCDYVTAFQEERNIKHESYFDILSDITKKYDVGLRLYPDSDLSATTQYHYALYNGNDLTGGNNGRFVEFSVNFENLITSNFSTDNSESANVAYISSKYPRNPSDKNIIETELTTYTPQAFPESMQRREVYIDKDISYRDGDSGVILQINTFRDLLTTAANEALENEYKDKEEFNCQIRANNSIYQLYQDYYLGDIVLIRDIFGNQRHARITETAESWGN